MNSAADESAKGARCAPSLFVTMHDHQYFKVTLSSQVL